MAAEMNVVAIDDDAALLRSIEILIAEKGHHVVCFEDPIVGCSFVKQNAERIDVLVLDYVLPGVTAECVLMWMADYLPKAFRIIVISGHAEMIDLSDLKAMGVETFLPKPLDFDLLCEAIEGKEIKGA